MADATSSAIVIGASGGIGIALLQALAGSGRDVALTALSRRRPENLPSGADWLHLDLENEKSIEDAAIRLRDGPPLETAFIASGILHDGTEMQPEKSLRSVTPENLARQFAINATGPTLALKHLLPLLPRDRRSVFAVLSARVGSIGDNRLGGWYGYRASKAALNQIIRTASIELSRTHRQAILVGLHPGTVDTSLSAPFGKAGNKTTPEQAAANLLGVAAGLGVEDSGLVFDWKGEVVPH